MGKEVHIGFPGMVSPESENTRESNEFPESEYSEDKIITASSSGIEFTRELAGAYKETFSDANKGLIADIIHKVQSGKRIDDVLITSRKPR